MWRWTERWTLCLEKWWSSKQTDMLRWSVGLLQTHFSYLIVCVDTNRRFWPGFWERNLREVQFLEQTEAADASPQEKKIQQSVQEFKKVSVRLTNTCQPNQRKLPIYDGTESQAFSKRFILWAKHMKFQWNLMIIAGWAASTRYGSNSSSKLGLNNLLALPEFHFYFAISFLMSPSIRSWPWSWRGFICQMCTYLFQCWVLLY